MGTRNRSARFGYIEDYVGCTANGMLPTANDVESTTLNDVVVPPLSLPGLPKVDQYKKPQSHLKLSKEAKGDTKMNRRETLRAASEEARWAKWRRGIDPDDYPVMGKLGLGDSVTVTPTDIQNPIEQIPDHTHSGQTFGEIAFGD